MPDPTYNSEFIFGTACRVGQTPAQRGSQFDAYPGLDGMTLLDGGGRGGTFTLSGVLVDDDEASVAEDETYLLSYCDNIARTFTDTDGREYPNVILLGESYKRGELGIRPTDQGACLPFSIALRSLS